MPGALPFNVVLGNVTMGLKPMTKQELIAPFEAALQQCNRVDVGSNPMKRDQTINSPSVHAFCKCACHTTTHSNDSRLEV